MMEEVWKPIEGYEGIYEVSNLGRVRSLDRIVPLSDGRQRFTRGRILKARLTRKGYLRVQLGVNNDHYIHRLVAESFIPNPDNLPQINHRDEDKANNHVDNLEWCDGTYNINYGTAIERATDTRFTRTVIQYTTDGREVARFRSINDAVRELGFTRSPIQECCNHKTHTAYGYVWEYADSNVTKQRHYVRNRGVVQMKMDGTIVATYESSTMAQRATGIQSSNIRNACRGLYSQAGGFKWKYNH